MMKMVCMTPSFEGATLPGRAGEESGYMVAHPHRRTLVATFVVTLATRPLGPRGARLALGPLLLARVPAGFGARLVTRFMVRFRARLRLCLRTRVARSTLRTRLPFTRLVAAARDATAPASPTVAFLEGRSLEAGDL